MSQKLCEDKSSKHDFFVNFVENRNIYQKKNKTSKSGGRLDYCYDAMSFLKLPWLQIEKKSLT